MTGGAGYIRMPPAVRESLTDWVNDGACKGMLPDFFFGEDDEHVQVDECRKVCAGDSMIATTKACAGWSRYNNGSHSPCDHPANGDDGCCDGCHGGKPSTTGSMNP